MGLSKNTIGAIGENFAINELLRRGWHVANLNSVVMNVKSVDLVAIKMDKNTFNHKSVLIQVKTLIQHKNENINFPTGFDLEQAANEDYLKNNIRGPYVFIVAKNVESEDPNNPPVFEYYIVSRTQMIKLLYDSNQWYLKKDRGGRQIKTKGVTAGITLKWLRGEGEPAKGNGKEFQNPLSNQESCLNNWKNIER